jgi:hypothetical protein
MLLVGVLARHPLSPVRGVAQVARRRLCLPLASTPDVPFCAAATMATAVVLARCSAPERIWSIGDLGGSAARRALAAERGPVSLRPGQAASVLAPVASPGTARPDVWTNGA